MITFLARTDEIQRIPIDTNVSPVADGWIRISPERSEEDDDESYKTELKLNEEIIGRRFNDTIEKDVIMHIAGFIVKKVGSDVGEDIAYNRWNDLLSNGGLIKASATLINYLTLLYKIFNLIFECDIKNILNRLNDACDQSKCITDFEENVPGLCDLVLRKKIRDLFFKCIISGRINKLDEKKQKEADENNRNEKIKQYLPYFLLFPFPPKLITASLVYL